MILDLQESGERASAWLTMHRPLNGTYIKPDDRPLHANKPLSNPPLPEQAPLLHLRSAVSMWTSGREYDR